VERQTLTVLLVMTAFLLLSQQSAHLFSVDTNIFSC